MKKRRPHLLITLAIGSFLLLAPGTSRADFEPSPPSNVQRENPDVGVTEHLGNALPLDDLFTDDHGQTVRLGQFFSGNKPVILQLGYFGCPALCGLISQGVVTATKQMGLKGGTDYQMVFVSVHPAETPSLAADKKISFVDAYGHPDEAEGFHFMVGEPHNIADLSGAVGFRYKMMPGSEVISHPAVLMICTPDGHVSRYLYGITFAPETLRLSLVDASGNKIGTTMDHLILLCCDYDSNSGGYKLAIRTMRIGGLLTMLFLASGITYLFHRGRRLHVGQAVPPSEIDADAAENE